MNIPSGLRFTKDHEWAKVEGNLATVGITEFAVHQLGDITLVELPTVGAKIKTGESIGTIESVKAVSDLFAPLTGTVQEINLILEDEPQAVNDHPYEAGWMIKIALSIPAELDALLDAASYQKHIASLEE